MIDGEQKQAGYQLKVHFNPDSVVNRVSTQAGESLRLFAFMTEIFESKEDCKVPDVKKYFPMWSVQIQEKSSTDLKQDLMAVLTETAVSNLLRSIGECLDELTWYTELYRFCIPNREMLSDEFNLFQINTSAILKGQHKSALKNRLEWIGKRYGMESAHEEIILTLNNLRNCYVHRKGLVSGLDVNNSDASALIIKYFRPFIFILRGGVDVEVTTNFIAFDGEVIKFKPKLEQKTFLLGERIGLSLPEFSHVCFSCWMFASDLAKQLPLVENASP